ncbi:2-phospho-L-lactate guanylyltransferase [Undibacterium arcticum]|uniref:3-phospho-D-glycerate guanylyltransferase n=1 Tax=Undibacterium arcticum TaxID=1762892 RepID=A0ABV7EUG1_9BURK
MKRALLWAVVPVKSFACAKQRLMSLLSSQERAGLARAMFEDVLRVLAHSPHLAGTIVVTSDADAIAIAHAAGVGVLDDSANAGLVPAVQLAAQHLACAKRAGMLVVPADLPLITAADIELIALAHQVSPSITLVAASNDGGTNALACSPPAALPFCFGEDSFRRHRDAALSLGLVPRVLTLPRFGRDIDRPDDLFAFLQHPSPTRSYAYLTNRGIAQRLRHRQLERTEFTRAEPVALYQKG